MKPIRKAPVPKPHIRMRKFAAVGRSAFPPTPPTAFQPGAPAGPDQAFPSLPQGAAAPGDTGA